MNTKCVNVFVLGAGASVDYGLPVWCELRSMLIKYLNDNMECLGSYKNTNSFIEELPAVGPCKKYPTVDNLISEFALESSDFPATTRAIFDAIKKIFKSKARQEREGWIETFVKNNNIDTLLNNKRSKTPSVFINFNYDTLLLGQVVDFFRKQYLNTPNRERSVWFTKNGLEFEKKYLYCARYIFHPHGILYLRDEDEIKIGEKTSCYPISQTCLNAHTNGLEPLVTSYGEGGDNAVSCHNAYENFTFKDITDRINELANHDQQNRELKLILLGVGPHSLEFNLKKIFEGQAFDVRQIHYTCTSEDKIQFYEQYFDRFEATTERYKDCQELAEKTTFIPFD